jgi:hypothetical protein
MTDRQLSDSTVVLLIVCIALGIAISLWAAVAHPAIVIVLVLASALGGGAYWKARL